MTPPIPSCEPVSVVAGDTWTWTHSNSDFPIADGWALSYSIRGASAPAWDIAWVSDDGHQWTAAIPATSTAALIAGTYTFERHYTLSGDRRTVPLPSLDILPNAATAAAGDLQSDDEKMLAAIWALLYNSGNGVTDVESYQIHGRQLIRMKRLELQQWYDTIKRRVERAKNGGQNPAIRIAFGRARA